jgi:hypothetical protein
MGHTAMGYKIIKESDHQFVVRSEEQDVLKLTSRRKAARTIADANDLMRVPNPDSVTAEDAQTETKTTDEPATI